jgi:hypothetical protein
MTVPDQVLRDIHFELGNVAAVAIVSAQLAGVFVAQGKYSAAEDLYREYIGTIRRHASVFTQGEALLGLGEDLGRGGDLDAARGPFAEARTLFASVGDQSNLVHADMIEGEVQVRGGAARRKGRSCFAAVWTGPTPLECSIPRDQRQCCCQGGGADQAADGDVRGVN